jgi:pimeloyl-ACP methyl ester carboxylesterase/uncharacterized membrane protein
MRETVVCFFERPGAAREARGALRELQRELRLGRIASVAVVTRPSVDDIRFEQDGDVGPGAGARFGLVLGALSGALLLAPITGLLAVGASLDGTGAPSERELRIGIALVAAFTSGLTALASALGGAGLGALAALLMNFGLSSRELYAVGEELAVGQAALVARVPAHARAPVDDLLALAGGTLMRPAERGAAAIAPDTTAAHFAAAAYERDGALGRRYEPVARPAPPVDPRQRDLVVAGFDGAAQARRAARELARVRRGAGRLSTGNLALVTRDDRGRPTIRQSGDVTAGQGALFGLGAGGLAGFVIFGFLGLFMGILAILINEGADAGQARFRLGALVGVVLVGGLGALVCGLVGALAGLVVARGVNLAFNAADLRRIAAALPAGQATLIASVYHHGAQAVADALRERGGRLQNAPLPSEQLIETMLEEGRRAALEAGDDDQPDTQRLITTRAGVRIFVDWRRRGPHTIVLLHGAGGDHLGWQVQYPALHGAGYSTLALDLRGHGYSDRPRGADDYRLERFAEDVADVLDALDVRDFVLVGHCFGGMVATMYHQAHPDRSKGYVLIDTAAQAPGVPRWLATHTPWLIGLAGRALELLPSERRRLLHADMPSFKGTRDIEPARLVSDAEHTTLRAWLLVYRGIAQYDGVASLRSMTQPVWVVVGEEDTVFTVEDSQTIQQHVPGSRLITVPGANHIIVVNNPEVVEGLILDFLKDNAIFERGGPEGGPHGGAAADARRATAA